MEVNPNSAQTPDSNDAATQRPGEYLAQIRKNKKLDLANIAKELTIPVKTLTALEQDDYQHLPQATFIKGFYRKYAEYLQADVNQVLALFDRVYTTQTGRPITKTLTDSPLQIKGKLASPKSPMATNWKKWIGYAIALLIVLGVITAIVQKVKSNKADATQDAQVEVIDLNANSSVAAPSKGTVVATSGEKLRLEFNRPTSVHIEDADGKVLATGRQASNLDVTGKAPFQVRIDDAAAATLTLNNERIDLSKYMVNGKVDFKLAR